LNLTRGSQPAKLPSFGGYSLSNLKPYWQGWQGFTSALKWHAHSVHYAHKLTTARLALKQQIALNKALVWSRGLPATLQLPTSHLFHWWRRLAALQGNASPCTGEKLNLRFRGSLLQKITAENNSSQSRI